MAAPHVLVLRAPGTNCDAETAFAFREAGAVVDCMHVNRLLEDPKRFVAYQILCIPGGFSYGDDIAAGMILGSQLRNHLADSLKRFVDDGKLVLGICNGFQVLVKSGLLPTQDETGPTATLAWNDGGKFIDRWVNLKIDARHCVFLPGMPSASLPIAHAEGRFAVRNTAVYAKLHEAGSLVMRYSDSQGSENSESTQLAFPQNPNGSVGNVAGICDSTGRVFGLMPHPERHIVRTQHPQWTRRPLTGDRGDGFQIFKNAVSYFR